MTTYGDRRGHDIGFYTGIKVDDYELIVHLKRETANSSVRVELPREFSVRASKLLKGDADFGGNGPHVFVQSLIRWTPNKITMVILIQAKDTKADWTTLLGDRSLTLYEAPPGLRINRFTFNGEPVGKNLSFPKMIEYIDTDHGNDNFGMFEME